eukprot:gb/GEZJ01003615.1/.p1 GENE.gb/GEZJ01003615.1/~~gb/GEZJ01003615.1/.p1  ORF type:complete len:300 (-),score=32.51 gb/GEZJ01003615.1/:2670-3569(-)
MAQMQRQRCSSPKRRISLTLILELGSASTPQRRFLWNAEFVLPLTVINDGVAQEGISLKLSHKVMPRLRDPFRPEKLVGQVSASFEELFKKTTTAVVCGDPADDEDDGDRVRTVALMKPSFHTLYGKPQGGAYPYDKVVVSRGRVLIGVGLKPGNIHASYVRQCPPPPRPKLQFYKLAFCVLRATELSLKDVWSVRLELASITLAKLTIQSMCVEWQERSAVFNPKRQFPEDVGQITDLFITLSARSPPQYRTLRNVRLRKKKQRQSRGVEMRTTPSGHQMPSKPKRPLLRATAKEAAD